MKKDYLYTLRKGVKPILIYALKKYADKKFETNSFNIEFMNGFHPIIMKMYTNTLAKK